MASGEIIDIAAFPEMDYWEHKIFKRLYSVSPNLAYEYLDYLIMRYINDAHYQYAFDRRDVKLLSELQKERRRLDDMLRQFQRIR